MSLVSHICLESTDPSERARRYIRGAPLSVLRIRRTTLLIAAGDGDSRVVVRVVERRGRRRLEEMQAWSAAVGVVGVASVRFEILIEIM